MPRKATKNTPNKELVNGILDDQAAFGIPHLSKGKTRENRFRHNLKELYRRLGETVEDNDLLYYC